jgi:hypothetical protein
MQILLKDETFAGKILDEILVQLEHEMMTVGELIRLKVGYEIAKHNETIQAENRGYFHSTESALNGKDSQQAIVQRRQADMEQETYKAWEAFQQNQLVILVDNRQVDSLEEEILCEADTQVSFVRLTQLVGG